MRVRYGGFQRTFSIHRCLFSRVSIVLAHRIARVRFAGLGISGDSLHLHSPPLARVFEFASFSLRTTFYFRLSTHNALFHTTLYGCITKHSSPAPSPSVYLPFQHRTFQILQPSKSRIQPKSSKLIRKLHRRNCHDLNPLR